MDNFWILITPPPHTHTHTVTLYGCNDLFSGYSECLASRTGSKFECGWCEGSCEVMQECSNSFDIEGENYPDPVITSFTPMSGKNTVSE